MDSGIVLACSAVKPAASVYYPPCGFCKSFRPGRGRRPQEERGGGGAHPYDQCLIAPRRDQNEDQQGFVQKAKISQITVSKGFSRILANPLPARLGSAHEPDSVRISCDGPEKQNDNSSLFGCRASGVGQDSAIFLYESLPILKLGGAQKN